MKRIILYSVSLLLLFITSCSYQDTYEINVDEITNSAAYRHYKVNSTNFNKPYLNKISELGSDQVRYLMDDISKFSSIYHSKVTNSELDAFAVKLGYEDKKEYEDLYLLYYNSLIDLMNEFPALKKLEEDELQAVLVELYARDENSFKKSKASANCTYDYSYCASQAEGTYYAGTAICALSALGSPFAALACQVINTAIYNGALGDCVNSYESCIAESE